MQKRGIQIKPELSALLYGLVALAAGVLVNILPPTRAPIGVNFLDLFLAYTALGCVIACLVMVVIALIQKRWMVVGSLAILTLSVYLMPLLKGPVNSLWMTKFKESHDLRQQFIKFMDQHAASDSPIKLPPHLRHLSDRKSAYLTVDSNGNKFYCYSVYTSGLDNSQGYCWSPSGKPPHELAFPQITNSRRIEGNHWYAFFST